MPSGGKRKGSGRKPRGKVAMLVRVAPETRQALEREARTLRHSLSHVAEQFLLLGIRTKRERSRPDAMRALCYLIAETADLVCNIKDSKGVPLQPFDWRTNPFMFCAFRFAVLKLLDKVAPPGEIQSPAEQMPEWKEKDILSLDTPEARADEALMVLWHAVQSAEDVSLKDEFSILPIDAITEMEQTVHTMARARADLQIGFLEHNPRQLRQDNPQYSALVNRLVTRLRTERS